MKFGGQKFEKQMVKRLCWDGKAPGICAGTKAAVAPGLGPAVGYGRRVRSPATSLTRAGRAAWHQEGPGCWKLLGGIETKWETHRNGTHLLGLWRPAPEKLGCWATPGEGRHRAMSDPDSDSLWTGWEVGLCETLCAY